MRDESQPELSLEQVLAQIDLRFRVTPNGDWRGLSDVEARNVHAKWLRHGEELCGEDFF